MSGSEKSDPLSGSTAAAPGTVSGVAAALASPATSLAALKASRDATLALAQALPADPLGPLDRARTPAPAPHGRIPRERVSGAHGYFECDVALAGITRATPFAATGRRTPVFARFSTRASERGSVDGVRDIRGFAVRFHTVEGIWDLVGRNVPVGLVRDPLTIQALVRTVQAGPRDPATPPPTAREMFWDVASRAPETANLLMWAMSDRTLPRSYRMMQGFGVHTFRLVDATGATRYCKFHWTPSAGTHSLVWNEAVRRSACDHHALHRDLWEAIDRGDEPAWTLGLQVFTQDEADAFGMDVLDPTKLVPEERVPVMRVGRLVLDRNPNNLLAESERVMFSPAHVVPGIALAGDPLLDARVHRGLGAEVARHDPMALLERCLDVAIVDPRGPLHAGRAEPAADPFTQAALFWNSQSDIERAHIVAAFVFELAHVRAPGVRGRMVSVLGDVDETLASRVAEGLRMPPPTRHGSRPSAPREAEASVALSLRAFPGDGSIAGRRIAIVVADGADAKATRAIHATLAGAGAIVRFVGAAPGEVRAADGPPIRIDATFEALPSALWDAVVVDASARSLCGSPIAVDFLRQQFDHFNTMWLLGDAPGLSAAMGRHADDGARAAGILRTSAGASDLARATRLFMQAVASHKHYGREIASSSSAP